VSRKKAIHSHYEPRISQYRANHEILDWANSESQLARFEVLAGHIDLRGLSLLDIGCGLGDLWAFLKARKLGVRYTGVDLVAKMVAAAQAGHADGRFVTGDVFADDLLGPERFDVVFCSGIFNLDLGNNEQFIPRALARLFELSGRYVAFNMLHIRAKTRYAHCYYIDPAKVLALVAPLARSSQCIDDYLPNDFTIVCEK
jgi:cyclopropane fatty-acyl-phospholipid synthase-like methyltransferase